MKYKWDKMSDNAEDKTEMSDIALNALLRELCTEDEYRMIEEDEEMDKMRLRMVYDSVEKRFNFSKKRVTDTKGNSRVTFPKEGGGFDDEAILEMVRLELKEVFSQYCVDKCLKGGAQKSNLDEAERRGLKSLRKRVSNSEIVLVPTDKSGRFAVMSLATYELAGQAHTNKDEMVDFSKVKSTQAELNGHVSMLVKTFKIGDNWNHGERMRETVINHSLAVCPMYLLYKDHKGWDISKGPIPPTRPVASGNRGMNMHLSGILSNILEPIAEGVRDSREVISTEDMVARLLVLDRSLEGWDEVSWLKGVKYEGFSACMECRGSEDYVFDRMNPELCKCGTGPLKPDEEEKDMVSMNNINEMMENMKVGGSVVVNNDGTKDVVSVNQLNDGMKNLKVWGQEREGPLLDNMNELNDGMKNLLVKDLVEPVELDSMEDGMRKLVVGTTLDSTDEGGSKTKDMFYVDNLGEYTQTTRTSTQFMELLRQNMWSELTEKLEDGEFLDSMEVRNEMIQDFGAPMEVIGFDVDALYPSLDWGNTEKVIRDSIMDSNIKWEEVDIMEGCRYIALNWDGDKCRTSPLRRVLPVRRAKTGVRPGLRGTGPLGPEVHDQEQWKFPDVIITEDERREIIATVVSIAVKELFSNHLYTFGNKIYRQSKGGAIGLDATCAIARVMMNVWDKLWEGRLLDLNLKQEVYTRYMDDGRSLLHPVRPGWRICEDGRLKFKKEWEREDGKITPTERTKQVLEGSMKGVMEGINLTMETKDDFDGEWLPTLDICLAIDGGNRLKFNFYEKPTCSNLTLQKSTAMEQNTLVGILANEVMRRMLNIGGKTGNQARLEAVDNYAVKLLTSGFGIEQTRRIILSGLKGYEGKVQRRKLEMAPLYRTSEDSGKSRARKKLLGKSTWFKGNANGGKGNTNLRGGKNMKRGNNLKADTGPLKTRTVLFVEHTPDGTLAKRLREQLERMEQTIGFKIKVVEHAGTKLKDMFSLTNLWGGSQCERKDCTTCTQEGEEISDCKRRGIVYESICVKCNPGATRPGPLKSVNKEVPSVYVGETSRSMYERAGEHWKAFHKRNTDSHIWKHHLVHHEGVGEPEMTFKVVGTFKSALPRQIFEAVRIRRRGDDVLNSKGEYNRSRIHRLTIDRGEETIKVGEQ